MGSAQQLEAQERVRTHGKLLLFGVRVEYTSKWCEENSLMYLNVTRSKSRSESEEKLMEGPIFITLLYLIT